MEKIKIKLLDGYLPKKGSEYAAAYDVRVPHDIELKNGRQVIGLGFLMELPHGHGALMQARSGFTAKGIECLHIKQRLFRKDLEETVRVDADVELGLIDEDYRDGVGILLHMHQRIRRNEMFIIKRGTRIAQMRIVAIPDTEIIDSECLDMSKNRGGGYGHSGAK